MEIAAAHMVLACWIHEVPTPKSSFLPVMCSLSLRKIVLTVKNDTDILKLTFRPILDKYEGRRQK